MLLSQIKLFFSRQFFLCLFVLLFSFSIIAALDPDELEVKFFNVGQGGAATVRIPGGSPLLYDAGSSKSPMEGSDSQKKAFTSETIGKIARQLKDYYVADAVSLRKPPKKITLNVIISHADADHANWITRVIEELKILTDSQELEVLYLLGGQKEDFPLSYVNPNLSRHSKVQATVQETRKLPSHRAEFSSAPIPHDFSLNFGKKVLYQIFAGYQIKDENYRSIVLRLEYGNHSFLLTGDATGKTTDEILSGALLPYLSSPGLAGKPFFTDILQASHHGADSENSTNAAWIDHVNPRYVIFSAANRVDYLHPKLAVMERFLKHGSRLEDTKKFHTLRFHDELKSTGALPKHLLLKAFAQEDNDYTWISTSLGVYNTHEQGDVSFSWRPLSPINVSYHKSEVLFPTMEEHILTALSNPSLWVSAVLPGVTAAPAIAAPAAAPPPLAGAVSLSFTLLDLEGLNFDVPQFQSIYDLIIKKKDFSSLEKLNLRILQKPTIDSIKVSDLHNLLDALHELHQLKLPDSLEEHALKGIAKGSLAEKMVKRLLGHV